MSYLSIEGGAPLHGELTIQGSKNSVLPVLAATILARDVCRIENCPRLRDVDASVAILRHLGCRVRRDGTALEVDTAPMARCDIPDELMREMRSSIIFLGAILARQGEAVLSYPGGCELGPRPIDLHLAALRELGAEITERYGELRCKAKCLRGTDITLAIPSVGATENAILAACGAEGTSVIYNAAREASTLRAVPRSLTGSSAGRSRTVTTAQPPFCVTVSQLSSGMRQSMWFLRCCGSMDGPYVPKPTPSSRSSRRIFCDGTRTLPLTS